MNSKITSVPLLTVAVVMISASAIEYANIASAMSNKVDNQHESDNSKYLSNCLSIDGTDSSIQWFEPLGCSLESGNTQSIFHAEIGDVRRNIF